MTNLQRVQEKIFASNAPASEVGQFGSAVTGTKVETTDIATIQALGAYTEGWGAAVVSDRNYPTLQEMNGVLKVLSYQTAYAMQKGVPEWNSGTTYYIGDICKGVGNGNLYICKVNGNIGNAVTNSTYWTLLDLSNNANVDLSNLSTTGEAKFSSLSNAIAANSNSITALTTTVNGKISATVNKAQTGSFLTSNGWLVNWGRVIISSGTHTGTATFKTPFTTSTPMVTITRLSSATTTDVAGEIWLRGLSTTGFDLYKDSSKAGPTLLYIAVGY